MEKFIRKIFRYWERGQSCSLWYELMALININLVRMDQMELQCHLFSFHCISGISHNIKDDTHLDKHSVEYQLKFIHAQKHFPVKIFLIWNIWSFAGKFKKLWFCLHSELWRMFHVLVDHELVEEAGWCYPVFVWERGD